MVFLVVNVISYLERSARRCPDRVCWADAQGRLTYAQAWAAVRTMGRALQSHLGPGCRPVHVYVRHCIADLIAFFAVVYSGNFYVPVDAALPMERISSMFDVVRPAASVGGEEDPVIPGVPHFTQSALLAEDAPEAGPPGWTLRKDADPLYVIFTSGSTGEPKGVTTSHRAVIDLVEQFHKVFQFEDGAVWGNQSPFDYDGSVKDVYNALKAAGRVEILENRLFSFPKLLIDRLNERHVDTVIWAAPALKIVARLNAFRTLRPLYLKRVMFSGEVMPPKTLAYWMDALPGAQFVNLYGPTEITCNCTYYVVRDRADVVDEVPIGKPFPNCDVFLLGPDGPVTAEGELGEICVSGTCLSLGYYNRPDLSSRVFVQHPFQTSYAQTVYRTGDLGFFRGGELFFCGRKDTQIKYMGHRVELTELELRANAADGVDVSACAFDAEQSRLALFYTGSAEEKALFDHLRSRLPRYMLPTLLKRLDAFPVTRTGKIDRKRLLAMMKEG